MERDFLWVLSGISLGFCMRICFIWLLFRVPMSMIDYWIK